MQESDFTFDRLVLLKKATWWKMDLPSGDVIFGDTKTDMLGYSADDFKKYQDFTKLVHKDDSNVAMQAMRDHLEGKKDFYEVSYRIKNSKGDYIRFYDCGKIYEKDGENISLMGFVMLDDDTTKGFKEDFKKKMLEGKDALIEMVKGIRV